MDRTKRPKPKIGYFGSGLAAYWPQFPNLQPAVLATMERHAARLEAMGCEVVRGGLVDRAELSGPAGDLFAREQVDLIIGEIMTYTASHVLVPVAQRNIAPYLTLALQMVPTVNYEHIGTEDMTLIGAAMTAPEVACAFNRCGLPFHCVVGGDFQEKVWTAGGGVDRGRGDQASPNEQPVGLPGPLLPGHAGYVHRFHDAPGEAGCAHRDRGDVRPGISREPGRGERDRRQGGGDAADVPHAPAGLRPHHRAGVARRATLGGSGSLRRG